MTKNDAGISSGYGDVMMAEIYWWGSNGFDNYWKWIWKRNTELFTTARVCEQLVSLWIAGLRVSSVKGLTVISLLETNSNPKLLKQIFKIQIVGANFQNSNCWGNFSKFKLLKQIFKIQIVEANFQNSNCWSKFSLWNSSRIKAVESITCSITGPVRYRILSRRELESVRMR